MAKLDDDTLITPALLRRFITEANLEAGNGQHYAFIQRSNGELLAHNPYSPEIEGHQAMFAGDVLKELNRDLHHDGAWVIVFTHPAPPAIGSMVFAAPQTEYRRFAIMWMDGDGDIQFTVEWLKGESDMLDFAEVLGAGIHSQLVKCESAWSMWELYMRQVIEPRAGDMYKRAMGQRPSSAVH